MDPSRLFGLICRVYLLISPFVAMSRKDARSTSPETLPVFQSFRGLLIGEYGDGIATVAGVRVLGLSVCVVPQAWYWIKKYSQAGVVHMHHPCIPLFNSADPSQHIARPDMADLELFFTTSCHSAKSA